MRSFGKKAVLFILCVGVLQIFIAHLTHPVVKKIALLDRFLAEGDRLIFFGDSTINYHDPSDQDTSSIAQMLGELNPEYSIGDFSSDAYQLEIYEATLERIVRSPHKPEAVIIPVNMRTFSPEYETSQFAKEEYYLRNRIPFFESFDKPLMTIHAIRFSGTTSDDPEFLSRPVYWGDAQVGTVSDFIEEKKLREVTDDRVKGRYIFSYMYDLHMDDVKLEAIRRMAAMSASAGVDLYFYVTPIDVQSGVKAVGPDFERQTRKNVDRVCSVLAQEGLGCLDLAFALGSEFFSFKVYPNEHLKEAGRRFVAQKISDTYLHGASNASND